MDQGGRYPCTWESMGHYGSAEQRQLTWSRGGWEGGRLPGEMAFKQKTVNERMQMDPPFQRPSRKQVHGTSQA